MRLNTHNSHHTVEVIDGKAYCLQCEDIQKDTSLINMYSYATRDELLTKLIETKKAIMQAEVKEDFKKLDNLQKHFVAIKRFV